MSARIILAMVVVSLCLVGCNTPATATPTLMPPTDTPPTDTPLPPTNTTTPTPTRTPTCTPTPCILVVQPGNTLAGIAKCLGTTVRELAEANHILTPDIIRVGQTLVVPPGVPCRPECCPTPTPTLTAVIETATPTQTPPKIIVAGWVWNAPGNDRNNPCEEYVLLRNVGGPGRVDIKIVSVKGNQSRSFSWEAASGAEIYVRSGCVERCRAEYGEEDGDTVYFNDKHCGAIWNNKGDTLQVYVNGVLVHEAHCPPPRS